MHNNCFPKIISYSDSIWTSDLIIWMREFGYEKQENIKKQTTTKAFANMHKAAICVQWQTLSQRPWKQPTVSPLYLSPLSEKKPWSISHDVSVMARQFLCQSRFTCPSRLIFLGLYYVKRYMFLFGMRWENNMVISLKKNLLAYICIGT